MHYTNILALMDARNVKDLNVDRLASQVNSDDWKSIGLLSAIQDFQESEKRLEKIIKALKERHA